MSDRSCGFDFTHHARRVCEAMVLGVPELGHIAMERVAVGFCQARTPGNYGRHASLTPMRFAGGRSECLRKGRRWGIQRLRNGAGLEMLYILNFYLPRFLNLPFRQKLTTIAHELWHIGPHFDGDVRRYAGRCYAHSPSQKNFDATAERLVEAYLASAPLEPLHEFLRCDFATLRRRHGQICGTKIRAPRLIPLGQQPVH